MRRNPQIVVTGILDTKGVEIEFLAERIRAAGGEPIVLELSLKKEMGWANIGLTTLLSKANRSPEELASMPRSEAVQIILAPAIDIIRDMIAQGGIDGMIAFGGSTGTTMATAIMRELPIGMPKLMLSTMASGDVSSYVGTRDITMLFPIAEVGLNVVTRRILNYAAAAIVGMASPPPLPSAETKPLIGCTMLGATTPSVLRASECLKAEGYDVIINHAVGSGGKSMEELINEGLITGVLDLSTHEITDFLLGGVMGAGSDRLTAACKKGIPQVVSTGGLEMIVFGPPETVPGRLSDEAAKGLPGRAIRLHNPAITIVGTTPDEAFVIGEHVAEKLNGAKGPTVLTVPMRGWSAYDIIAPDLNLGWAGPGQGPFWAADPRKPERSLRAARFLEGLYGKIDRTNTNLAVVEIDRHFNDPEFADFNAKLLSQMLQGTYKREDHRKD